MITSKYEVIFRWSDYRPNSSNSGCVTSLYDNLEDAKKHVENRFKEDEKSVTLMPNSLMCNLINEENTISWVIRIDKIKVFVKYFTVQIVLDEIDKKDI